MKKKVLIVAIVVVLILIAGGFAIASSNSDNSTQPTPTQPTPIQPPPPVQPTPNEPAVLELTVEQLIKNVLANPQIYEGKVIQASGVVIDRQVGSSGIIAILGPETMGWTVEYEELLAAKNHYNFVNLSRGEKITIRGKYRDFNQVAKVITLKEGLIIEKK